MAFLRAARPAGREWTVEEAAVYAARRDYELLKLLSADKKALRTARILGMQLEGQQQQQRPKQEAHIAAATQEQSAAGSMEVARKQRKRRPPNAARRQKQRERSQQKRMKQKLLAVLPIINKWALQHRDDVEMPPASPPPSPPQGSGGECSVNSVGSTASMGSATEKQQRTKQHSYAAAAQHAAAATQQPVQNGIAAKQQQRSCIDGAARSEATAAQRYIDVGRILAQHRAASKQVRPSTSSKQPMAWMT